MKVTPSPEQLAKLGVARDQMGITICRNCVTASGIIRKLGFRDNISWGVSPEAPTQRLHATHSNAGVYHQRVETEAEHKRRMTDAPLFGRSQPPEGQMVSERVLQPLCVFYSSEIAWLTAGQPRRLTVYMAHPVAEVRAPNGTLIGNSFADNVQDATCWLRFLRRVPLTELQAIVGVEFEQRPLILAPWLAGIEPDESYPGGREAVIADSRDTAMLFDEGWMFGGRVSSGMLVEGGASRFVRDLTHLGTWSEFRPPTTNHHATLKPKRR